MNGIVKKRLHTHIMAMWRRKNAGEQHRLSHKKSSFLQQHQSSLPLLPFATRRDGRIIGHDVCCM